MSDFFKWATVTAIEPLRIKLDTESEEILVTPDTLTGDLGEGDRVWCRVEPRRAPVIVGKLGAIMPPPPPPLPSVREEWYSSSGSYVSPADDGTAIPSLSEISLTLEQPCIVTVTLSATITLNGSGVGAMFLSVNEDMNSSLPFSAVVFSGGGIPASVTRHVELPAGTSTVAGYLKVTVSGSTIRAAWPHLSAVPVRWA